MGAYQVATAKTVTDAKKWADESTKLWLDTYVAMVDRAADGTGKANDAAKDMAKLSLAAQRDMARVMNTWINLGTALVELKIK